MASFYIVIFVMVGTGIMSTEAFPLPGFTKYICPDFQVEHFVDENGDNVWFEFEPEGVDTTAEDWKKQGCEVYTTFFHAYGRTLTRNGLILLCLYMWCFIFNYIGTIASGEEQTVEVTQLKKKP